MDLGTGLAVFGTAKIAERLLGPTAEYAGEGLRHWTERRVQNVQRIVGHAVRRLGPRLDEPGAIPPRILRDILADGSYCDDELTASYYGGVLASSRTVGGRDDSGKTYLALVNRLSVYQVRTHYILYALTRRLYLNEQDFDPSDWDVQQAFVPFASYQRAMDFSDDELRRFQPLLEHTLFGLQQEGLIGAFGYVSDEQRWTQVGYANPQHPGGINFTPSILGTQLYLWACGFRKF